MLGTALKGIFMLNGNAFSDESVRIVFVNNIFLIAVSILACTPIIPAIGRYFERKRVASQNKPALALYDFSTAIIPVCLVAISALALVGDSYNPFLYFRF